MDDFDVQVHHRGMYNEDHRDIFETSIPAQHDHSCAPPPSTHTVTHVTDSVFMCNNHLMTATEGGYAVTYLTPNRMLDWSDGEATLSIDVSTLRMSNRDWWDLWLTDFDSQLAVPLSDRFQAAGVDLNGAPNGDYLHLNLIEQNVFYAESEAHELPRPPWGVAYNASSATQRDTFVLTIRRSTFDFCKPDESMCWYKDQPHELNINQAVVQIGHHSYDPVKDGGQRGTWHWDNLSLSDSVPFTLIRGDKRSVTTGPWYAPADDAARTVHFAKPAPANSYLRFSAIALEPTINGKRVQPIVPQDAWHHNSYLVPIPEGTTSITWDSDVCYSGSDCVAKDFSIVSRATGSSSPAPTSTPTRTPTPRPTTAGGASPTVPPASPTTEPAPPNPAPSDPAPAGSRIPWQGSD
jgi:hypothetical protein